MIVSIETKVKKTGRTNAFIVSIWKDYRKYSSKEERDFDWNIPLIIACSVIVISFVLIKDGNGIVSALKDFNNVALTVVAILAGFNTVSLSVIAASNTKALGKLFASERQDDAESKSNLLRQTISLFGYSIIVELIILVVGTMLIFILNSLIPLISHLNDSKCWCIILKASIALLAIPWIAFIFHSLFISIRNISILYNYILFLGEQAKDDHDSDGI